MNQIAPPSPARCGGATTPPGGMVPRPAASHPEPARGMHAGILVPPCKTSPSASDGAGGLSSGERIAAIRKLQEDGKNLRECAEILGISYNAVKKFSRYHAVRQARVPVQYKGPHDDRVCALIAADRTLAEIAAAIGVSRRAVKSICDRLGITSTPAARTRAIAERNVAAATKRRAGQPVKDEAPTVRFIRNHRLSPAQQANVDAVKGRMWEATRNDALRTLPKPSRDEAAALVAAYLARGGTVTVCPPPASLTAPTNAGAGFGFSRTSIGTNWVQARRG